MCEYRGFNKNFFFIVCINSKYILTTAIISVNVCFSVHEQKRNLFFHII